MNAIGISGGSSLYELGTVNDVQLFFDCMDSFVASKQLQGNWNLLSDRLYKRYLRLDELDDASMLMGQVKKIFMTVPKDAINWSEFKKTATQSRLDPTKKTLAEIFDAYFEQFDYCVESAKINYEELTFTPENVKVPRDSRQTAAGKEGNGGDVGGHAQACSQGGTCDGYNLFPQNANFNNSAYKVFYENEIGPALKDPAQTVGETTIKYVRKDPASVRPDSMELTYPINGKQTTVKFENEANSIPEITQ